MKQILLAFSLSVAAFAQPPEFPTPRDLARELDRLAESENTAQLPGSWKIRQPETIVSAAPLRAMRDRERIESLKELAAQLRGYAAPAPDPNARQTLDRILSRGEFAAAKPPSQWQIWRQRLVEWGQDLLRRIFDFAAQRPTTSKILFWTVISIALFSIIVFLAKLWSGASKKEAITQPHLPKPSSRRSEDWTDAAQHAAKNGEFAAAIQAAYWAAIARLEELSAFPPHRACTPREYLRLAAPEHHTRLRTLTQAIERFWYARQPARPEDYQQTLAQLKDLGCKLD